MFHCEILATLMDKAMALSMYAAERVMDVTAKIEMKYRRQVSLDGELTERGRITRVRGRRIAVEAMHLRYRRAATGGVERAVASIATAGGATARSSR